MLHVASVCTPCCMLLDVVARCCAKFETGQTFQPTTPNISFVPWSAKRSATMLDPFAQLFQHCWGHVRSLRMDYKDLWVVFFPRCTEGPKLVGNCCIRLHTTANTHATIPTLLAQQCWELLHLFARSLSTRGNSRASLCGLNAIFYDLTVIKIHTSRFLTNQNASTISVLVFNEKVIKWGWVWCEELCRSTREFNRLWWITASEISIIIHII